ncbi:uncharacterized protein [Diadema antillarum]|uniref:uncharacterized protein n=1 Tax=Diadema antillarum TaxID=105358 RepID=UPI003A85D78B
MASLEQIVQRNLHCPICQEYLKEPKLLACPHTFCTSCLRHLQRSNGEDSDISCPLCHHTTIILGGDAGNLRADKEMGSLPDQMKSAKQQCTHCGSVDDSPAVTYCQDCELYMCEQCQGKHNAWRINSKHRVVSVEDIRRGKVRVERKIPCQNHPQEEDGIHLCTDICIDCRKTVCIECRVLHHEKKGHSVLSYSEYNKSRVSKLDKLDNAVKDKMGTLKAYAEYVEQKERSAVSHLEREIAHVKAIRLNAVKKLTERKTQLMQTLEKEKEAVQRQFKELELVNDKFISRIERGSESVQKCLKNPLEGDAVAVTHSRCKALSGLLDKDDPDSDVVKELENNTKSVKFIRCKGYNELHFGDVVKIEWKLEKEVKLPMKNSMNALAPTSDGKMALGSCFEGVHIYSRDGELCQTVLKNVKVREISFLSDGRAVVLTISNNMSLYTPEFERLPSRFDNLSHGDVGSACLATDGEEQIFVSYRKCKKIQVFTPSGGKAIREMPCSDFSPQQVFAMNFRKDLVFRSDKNTIRLIDESGVTKHLVSKDADFFWAFPAVRHDDNILIGWVNYIDKLLIIDLFTVDLKYVRTLVKNQKIDIPKREWFYMQEYLSGEIAFCTTDKLYIFTGTHINQQMPTN